MSCPKCVGMRVLTLGVVTTWAIVALVASTANANLLTNGSFETGDFSGWTMSANFNNTKVVPTTIAFGAQDGNFYVLFGSTGADSTLSQTFADTPGGTLQVSGWLVGDGSSPSDWNMSINGVTFVSVNPVPNQPYTEFTFTAPATGLDTFVVGFRDDPAFGGTDNFVITEIPSTVPQPATLTLLGVALVGIGLASRRRKTQ